MSEGFFMDGNFLLGTIVFMVSLIAWAVRAEVRGRSNTHRLNTLETDAKEDTKDWRRAQKDLEGKVDSVVKLTWLIAGKLGIDPPSE